MKVLGLFLIALAASVQGRSTGVETNALSTAGNPWVVHLRIAVSNGDGLLNSCVGSLIDNRWALTAATCLQEARFIWIRYGATNVINPELVTESSTISVNGDIGLISINRNVEYTSSINAVVLAGADDAVPATGTVCVYGATEENTAGETLSCSEWNLVELEDGTIQGVSEDAQATVFDLGASLVSNGVQIGVLVRQTEDGAVFVNPANFKDWIENETSSSF